jgi:hypothetical protein
MSGQNLAAVWLQSGGSLVALWWLSDCSRGMCAACWWRRPQPACDLDPFWLQAGCNLRIIWHLSHSSLPAVCWQDDRNLVAVWLRSNFRVASCGLGAGWWLSCGSPAALMAIWVLSGAKSGYSLLSSWCRSARCLAAVQQHPGCSLLAVWLLPTAWRLSACNMVAFWLLPGVGCLSGSNLATVWQQCTCGVACSWWWTGRSLAAVWLQSGGCLPAVWWLSPESVL